MFSYALVLDKGEKMSKNNSNTTTGIGFCGLLTIAFIVLKLVGVIKWSWFWVLAPTWIPMLIAIGFIILIIWLDRK